MHDQGVGLWRLAPVAWLATIALAFTANLVAIAGYGFSHVQMQTVLMLTCFTGWIALAGTAQWVSHIRAEGRVGRAWTVTAMILLIAVAVVTFAIPSLGPWT